MRRTSSFPTVWRFGLAVFALVAATQYAIDTFHAPQGVRSGVLDNGLFRGGFLRERGPTTFVVDALPPGSPLIAAGVVPGDRLRWSDPVGRWHNVPVGESFDLTVIHGSESRVIRVTTPARSETTRFAVANYVLDNLSRLATLVVAFIVGWRRSDLAAFRWLAIGGLMEANQFPFAAPAAAHLPWLDFLSSVSQELALGAMVFFAINYPDDRPVGLRAWLKRWYPWYFGALVAVTLYYYARLYSGYHEPWVGPLNRINAIVLPILFVVSMLLAWYRAQGETRIRLQWILATLGSIMVAVLIGNLNTLAGFPLAAETMALFLNAAIFAAILGFAYALMRARIFDFGLAVNRTLVFAIVGAVLLGVFQAANRLVSTFLHFDDENKTILLTAILAIAVYLSFTQLKKVVERLVDRVFFGAWAAREEELKAFVAEAKHATDAQALSTLLVAALDRFTESAGAALYRGTTTAASVASSPRSTARRTTSARTTQPCSRCWRTARRRACARTRPGRRCWRCRWPIAARSRASRCSGRGTTASPTAPTRSSSSSSRCARSASISTRCASSSSPARWPPSGIATKRCARSSRRRRRWRRAARRSSVQASRGFSRRSMRRRSFGCVRRHSRCTPGTNSSGPNSSLYLPASVPAPGSASMRFKRSRTATGSRVYWTAVASARNTRWYDTRDRTTRASRGRRSRSRRASPRAARTAAT
jgi:signal transduction histidine kinase